MANLSNINNKFLVTTTGEVLIGGTAAIGAAKLQVTGEARVYTGSNLGYWGVDAGNSYVYLGTNSSGYGLSLQTAGTERMRIDSSGNLLLGNGVGNPYLAFLSAGGNGGNERARMFGYADGGTYGGGLKLQTRDNSNIFNDALVIDRSGNAVIKGKIESVKELVNINSANGIRSAGLESDSTGNIWLGTGTTAATINFVTGNSTNGNPSVNGVKRLTTNREGTDVYASYAGNTFPFRVGYLNGSTYTPTFVVDDNSNVGIGTDAPGSLLHIKGETKAYITFEDTTDGTIGFVGDAAQMLTSGTFDNLGLRGEGGIQFGVSNVIKMVLDSSGNLGIGVTPPSTVLLDLKEADAGSDLIIGLTAGTGARAQIRSEAQSNDTKAELGFYTVTGSSTSEAMRINQYGNVGIGTDSPQAPLQVNANIYSIIRLGADYNYSANREWQFRTNTFGTIGWGGIALQQSTAQQGNTFATKFGIDINGNVGIGTTTPGQKLDVDGQMTHDGLVLKTGTSVYIDTIQTIDKTLSITGATWTNTGIEGTDIAANGSYMIQVYSNAFGSTGGAWYSMYWTGVMSWYKDSTNGSNVSEIYLNFSGHALNSNVLQLRTIQHTSSGSPANKMSLEIKTVNTLTNAPISFRFRRLM